MNGHATLRRSYTASWCRPPSAAMLASVLAAAGTIGVLASCTGAGGNDQLTGPLAGNRTPGRVHAAWVGQGNFKVCKVAGAGVASGTKFTFTVGTHTITVDAGAYPTGNCVLEPALYPTGTHVTITEAAQTNTFVYSIVVSPSGNLVGSPNLSSRSVIVKAGSAQTTTVTFTNAAVEAGCTLTQGFYKNHESVDATLITKPSPYTSGGKLVIGSSMLTAAEIVTVLQTPPKGGNAVLILEHQLIAAELNILGGASAPANVLAAITQANTLLASGQGSTQLAGLLDQYNEGLTGPGHCSG